MIAVLAFYFIVSVYSQNNYYVSPNGSDTSSCDSQSAPCATINQVFVKYPGSSYTVSISSGVYSTTPISLQRDAAVILLGTGNPTIVTSDWREGQDFITNTATTGLEIHDLTLNLTAPDPTDFTELSAESNTFGLYNVVLIVSISGVVFDVYGGSVTLSNITLTRASSDVFIFFAHPNGRGTNITVTGSTVADLQFGQQGLFLTYRGSGDANIVINSTTFNNISTDNIFIGIWAEDTNQVVTISNNLFNNTHTYIAPVYVQNDYECVIYVSNTTWNNAIGNFVSGCLEILGSGDGKDHIVALSSLTFTNCTGPYVGGLFVAENSLNITNSSFYGNSGKYANDVVQGQYATEQFPYSITNSYSSSALPKAGVLDLSSGTVTDISDQLPNPRAVPIHAFPLTREKLSASSKDGRRK